MRKRRDPLLWLVESFFRDHLQRMRGVSPHTVRAYRDTLRMLFTFLADERKCAVDGLLLTDLRAEAIVRFLTYLESRRGNSAATRNGRLAAIRCFCKHLLRHDLDNADQYQRILALPSKKARVPTVTYLEPEDVRVILDQPDRKTASGQRDHALLLFLYNTGARVSEALAVRAMDLNLLAPKQVQLHGKGRKDRLCPLWPETVRAMLRLSTVREAHGAEYIFRNQHDAPLSRDGVAWILDKYVAMAAKLVPTLARRHITPHSMRHSCAVALLQAGTDITVIRDYLGHASIATTNRYISTNLKMKRDALEAFWLRAGISPVRAKQWKPTPALLAFLAAL